MLRERAYGAKADIHNDIVALERLRELEGSQRAPTVVVENVPDKHPAIPPEKPASPAAVFTETPKASSLSKSRWRLPILWASSVLVTIIATALVTGAVTQRIQMDPYGVGAKQVARLSMDPGTEIPGFFTNEGTLDTQVFSEFYGQRVLVAPDGSLFGRTSDVCIMVTKSDFYDKATKNSYTGDLAHGCAANEFPAAVTIEVTRGMSMELLREYPEGTALQFVFDEAKSDVVVFSSAD